MDCRPELIHRGLVKLSSIQNTREGLLDVDWPWSSFSFYANPKHGLIRVDPVH
jgi:hypothetical protein